MNIAVLLLAGSLSAISTFILNNHLKLGGVMASAGISVLAGLFFHLFPDLLNPFLSSNLPLVIMGASFIGMASQKVVPYFRIISIAGILFSIIYLITGSFFEGFGGSLGTTAAISLFATYVLKRKKEGKPNP